MFLKYFIIFSFLFFPSAQAASLDSDQDGVPNKDEINIYHTDPYNHDTDEDGYKDWRELNNGYSPLDPRPIKLEKSDFDKDGLSDRLELSFKTDLTNSDTDGDGELDGAEIEKGNNPLLGNGAKLEKSIIVDISEQKLSYFLGGIKLGEFLVSTGLPGMSTPLGKFKIDGKHLIAYSRWNLSMPYWMSLQHGYFGFHELPVWPNGKKEGADSLGKKASHGCIRLGVGPAEFMYNWSPLGTPVLIKD